VKGRVLYIEDNVQNLYLITFILKASEYSVIQAMSGEEGIALASEQALDLILLDIQLPGMDGYEIARRLRLLPELQRIPIVAVTSYAMVGDREKALAAGCDGYIEKPINPETFMAQVEVHLHPERA
jgi:two-component system, cell cycle response regulator DivK